MEPWPDEPITVRDARLSAHRRLQALGHPEARLTDDEPDGADIVAPAALARIDVSTTRTGVEAVQALAGMAAVEGKAGCVFTLPGFTDEAIAWADRAGVALFVFDRHGQPEPVGRIAADAVARNLTGTAPFGTGDRADEAVVAAVLTDGLVSGGLGQLGLWSSGAGQILTFDVEPGDDDVPASVTVTLYPPVLPDELRLASDWRHARQQLPGGGYEHLWTVRCVRANQPPTAVAGEAVLRAAEALDACGVEFDRCRVELRPSPGGNGKRPEVPALSVDGVLGPVGRSPRGGVALGARATSAQVVARLLERARGDGGDGARNRATVEGVSERGETAWRLVARHAPRRVAGGDRWRVEASIPAELIEADRGGRWFRSSALTVGATRWSLSGGNWRTSATGPDLESLAHEVVADLSAAYAIGGQAFEDTALRESG